MEDVERGAVTLETDVVTVEAVNVEVRMLEMVVSGAEDEEIVEVLCPD